MLWLAVVGAARTGLAVATIGLGRFKHEGFRACWVKVLKAFGVTARALGHAGRGLWWIIDCR